MARKIRGATDWFMELGWDPIDELEDETPTPGWVWLVAAIIIVLCLIAALA